MTGTAQCKNGVVPLESIREPSSGCGGRRCKDDCPETVAAMSGHKRKVGEGKLFWLTAYLQFSNYTFKYFEPE